MAYYEVDAVEHRCQMAELNDAVICEKTSERDVLFGDVSLHICSDHYEQALEMVKSGVQPTEEEIEDEIDDDEQEEDEDEDDF